MHRARLTPHQPWTNSRRSDLSPPLPHPLSLPDSLLHTFVHLTPFSLPPPPLYLSLPLFLSPLIYAIYVPIIEKIVCIRYVYR